MTDQTGRGDLVKKAAVPGAQRTAAMAQQKPVKLSYAQTQALRRFGQGYDVHIGSGPKNLDRAMAGALERKGLVRLVGLIELRKPYTRVDLTKAGQDHLASLAGQPKQEAKPWEMKHEDLRARTKQVLGVLRDARTDQEAAHHLKAIRKEAASLVTERLRRHIKAGRIVTLIQNLRDFLSNPLAHGLNPNGLLSDRAIIATSRKNLAGFLRDLKKLRATMPRSTFPKKETEETQNALKGFSEVLRRKHQGETP